jgi:hypothetical protein
MKLQPGEVYLLWETVKEPIALITSIVERLARELTVATPFLWGKPYSGKDLDVLKKTEAGGIRARL